MGDNLTVISHFKFNNMIDNFDKVKFLLEFDSDDDFYYLQILQRKKENPQLGSNSRVIKNYYIKSLEYLENRYEEIKQLCDMFNARAMIRLNKRSWEKVAFKTIVNVANSTGNREYEFIRKSYDRACGQGHNDKNKKWILDLDGNYTEDQINEIRSFTKILEPNVYTDKTLEVLPSKNGFHIIANPFNLQSFKNKYPNIEIHKDNPTNLYIP
jgi:hypothetical protein